MFQLIASNVKCALIKWYFNIVIAMLSSVDSRYGHTLIFCIKPDLNKFISSECVENMFSVYQAMQL